MATLPKRRNIWFFTCKCCQNPRRQATRKYIALEGVCRKCRRSAVVDKNQMELFAPVPPSDKPGDEIFFG